MAKAFGREYGQFLKTILVDEFGLETGVVDNPLRVDPTGTTIQPVVIVGGVTLTPLAVSFSSSGANTIVPAVAAKTVSIYRLVLVAAGATVITLQDTAGTPNTFTGAMTLFAGGSIELDDSADPYWTTISGNGFAVNSTNAVQVSGSVWYVQA